METYSTTDIIRFLKEKQITLFSLADFERLFNISNQNTLYKKIQRLEKEKLIQKLVKGKYLFFLNQADDFSIANYIYQPSYVSLESALSFYSIITGFTYKISSISTKKSRTFDINKKEFQYSQIKQNLYWGYEKKADFLIAEPEKALLDYIYFSLKGLRNLDWEEIDLTEINKQKLITYAKRFNHYRLLSIVKNKSL